jgi:hypothetical protein
LPRPANADSGRSGDSANHTTSFFPANSCGKPSRNSSFSYKGRTVDIRSIGRDLGDGSVLEGSVRRAGMRLRIMAQLIDAASGGHLWAERFDRDMSDLFEVQDDVTSRIVEALKVTMSPAEKVQPGPIRASLTSTSFRESRWKRYL